MKRRRLLKGAIATATILGLAGTATWFSISENTEELSIDAALAKLNELSRNALSHNGQWNPFQIFSHCAQSIEFSMSGFPEHKSEIFKNTVGHLAFTAFSAKGKMTHGLSEVIPGAPLINNDGALHDAIARLKSAFTDFKAYEGDLAPHFAYGQLTKQQYEVAHVIHFYNHLQEIDSIAI